MIPAPTPWKYAAAYASSDARRAGAAGVAEDAFRKVRVPT
jgi:hypothetical protein